MKARSQISKKTSQSAAQQVQPSLRSRPFAPPLKPEAEQAPLDLQTQLENAQRFGHHFGQYKISSRSSDLPPIQPKLTIGAPGDKYEQEADRVAQQVVQQLNATKVENTQSEQAVQRETLLEEDEELQMKPFAGRIQRVEMPEDDDELQMMSMVQRSSDGAMPASETLESAIARARGSGQALEPGLQTQIGQVLGADFSGVRVHTDTQSDRLNQSIQARAFTTGQDVFFRQGAYQPGSREGQELIAHELTHVMQQNVVQESRKVPKPRVGKEKQQDEDGRPDFQLKQGTETQSEDRERTINNDVVMEREVEAMEAQSLRLRRCKQGETSSSSRTDPTKIRQNSKMYHFPALLALKASTDSMATVQRNGDSAKLLTELAKPKVFEGPKVKVQDKIVVGLEEQFEQLKEKEGEQKLSLYGVSTLGGIELPSSKVGSLEELIKESELADIGKASLGRSSYDFVKKAGVEKLIVENTLHTMESAGQLEYLRKSGLIDENWKVIVEVHYYRDRDKSSTRLHKDTLGQTLFVNLNFANEEEIAGPEYVMNPLRSQEHDERLKQSLPEVFRNDLKQALEQIADPEKIKMTVVPKKGVVSFVDEALHHKTPTIGHRKVSSEKIREHLKTNHKEDYEVYIDAYEKWKKQWYVFTPYTFESYLRETKKALSGVWLNVLKKTENEKVEYGRNEMLEMDPKSEILNMDELAELGGYQDFGKASIPKLKEPVPVQKEGKKLKRQMSDRLLLGTAPKPVPGRRTFFRTWVRAVPKEK
jgi:Domain of unknown function (DUF4157)